MKALCNEPHGYRPWEIGRLTPFQVRHGLLCERSEKDGKLILDAPYYRPGPVEMTLDEEHRAALRLAHLDPAAVDVLAGKD